MTDLFTRLAARALGVGAPVVDARVLEDPGPLPDPDRELGADPGVDHAPVPPPAAPVLRPSPTAPAAREQPAPAPVHADTPAPEAPRTPVPTTPHPPHRTPPPPVLAPVPVIVPAGRPGPLPVSVDDPPDVALLRGGTVPDGVVAVAQVPRSATTGALVLTPRPAPAGPPDLPDPPDRPAPPTAAPTVHVTVGRIEVRLHPPLRASRDGDPAAPPAAAPALSLEEYLRRREEPS
ncbi:hypothetical protein [Kineococcus aurantiacus]|uniref:Uncharacterized protein n=1 Tax=Kineococcus aurantiacus TaxID=37633 RepID=A0A7Y9DQ46_9ACTN|nr:hypothetical protein [Kineococcus aurantiacus]NYD24662.1 hypothetical protein [Kineococcus aurantiacus]